MDNNLKDYREKELKYYAIGNALLILLLSGFLNIFTYCTEADVSLKLTDIGADVLATGVISSIVYVYIYIIDSVVSSRTKEMICNMWRKLPGETIFEDIKNERIIDKRFNKNTILEHYSDLYERIANLDGKLKRRESNEYWYKLFRKNENNPRVMFSHRDYLLCRDLFMCTTWIGFMYLLMIIMKVTSFSWHIVLLILVELVMTNVSARSKQLSFAINVIASDIYSE